MLRSKPKGLLRDGAGPIELSTATRTAPDPPPPKPTPAGEADAAPPPNPEETASLFSRLFFTWLSPLMSTGSVRALEHSDLYALRERDTALHNSRRLAAEWARVRAAGGSSFFRATHRAYGAEFWLIGLLKLVNDVCIFVNPWLIYQITDYIAENEQGTSAVMAFVYAFGIFASLMVGPSTRRDRARPALRAAALPSLPSPPGPPTPAPGPLGRDGAVLLERLPHRPQPAVWYRRGGVREGSRAAVR